MKFWNKYTHSLDEKGRVALPAKFRYNIIAEVKETKSQAVITIGINGCLVIYTPKVWQEFEEKIKLLPQLDPQVLAFLRQLYSGTTDIEFDKQGRIFIPANLREYAKLRTYVEIIGIGNKIELWSPDQWQKYIKKPAHHFDKLTIKISSLI